MPKITPRRLVTVHRFGVDDDQLRTVHRQSAEPPRLSRRPAREAGLLVHRDRQRVARHSSNWTEPTHANGSWNSKVPRCNLVKKTFKLGDPTGYAGTG